VVYQKNKWKTNAWRYPWLGIDPIATAAQIIMGIQTIVSRNINLAESPAVISVGQINAGVSNVIPEELIMTGTIRSLDVKVQEMLHSRKKSSNVYR
jgi:metal-dependent amidase/aminoacylase/carboxypeptidase family protein